MRLSMPWWKTKEEPPVVVDEKAIQLRQVMDQRNAAAKEARRLWHQIHPGRDAPFHNKTIKLFADLHRLDPEYAAFWEAFNLHSKLSGDYSKLKREMNALSGTRQEESDMASG